MDIDEGDLIKRIGYCVDSFNREFKRDPGKSIFIRNSRLIIPQVVGCLKGYGRVYVFDSAEWGGILSELNVSKREVVETGKRIRAPKKISSVFDPSKNKDMMCLARRKFFNRFGIFSGYNLSPNIPIGSFYQGLAM